MRAVPADISRSLSKGSSLVCADNTGARELNIVSVKNYRGVRRRQPKAGLGDIVVVSVRKGDPDMRRQVLEAVIIRQRKPFKRPDGTRVKFQDNAAVLIDDNQEPRGTEIRGPVAREVADRFGTVASTARMIV